MSESSNSFLAGELRVWPSKERMAAILRSCGLRVYVGNYSIRIEDFDHWIFQEYGGDLGDPNIEADADTTEELTANARQVSTALTAAGLAHRFEIYDESGVMTDYLHHDWPQ